MCCDSYILCVFLLKALSITQTISVEQDQFFSAYRAKDLEHQRGNATSRSFLKDRYVWKNSTLLYSFGTGLSVFDEMTIKKAMKTISKRTKNCVHFKRTNDPKKLQIIIYGVDDSNCDTSIDFKNNVMMINLTKYCMKTVIIQHELLHALGFTHMHNHPDRDKYVKIHIGNIIPDKIANFEKRNVSDVPGEPYDYDSIMHYSAYAGSKNGLPTIVPLKRGVQIGQRMGLSAGDVRRLKKVYCPKKNATVSH